MSGLGSFVAGALGLRPKKVGPDPSETALAETSRRQFNDFVTRYVPAGEKFARITAATGNAVARTAAGASLAAARKTRGARRSPIGVAQAAQARGAGVARGVNAAREAVVQRERQGLQRLIAFGRGVQYDAQFGLGEAGRNAINEARQATDLKFQSRAGLLDAGLSIAGAAGAKYALKNPEFEKRVEALGALRSVVHR